VRKGGKGKAAFKVVGPEREEATDVAMSDKFLVGKPLTKGLEDVDITYPDDAAQKSLGK
jgi:hypothetical protein